MYHIIIKDLDEDRVALDQKTNAIMACLNLEDEIKCIDLAHGVSAGDVFEMLNALSDIRKRNFDAHPELRLVHLLLSAKEKHDNKEAIKNDDEN